MVTPLNSNILSIYSSTFWVNFIISFLVLLGIVIIKFFNKVN